MRKIRLNGMFGLSVLTGIYILLLVSYLAFFGGRYDTLDPVRAEGNFKTALYASYTFPAFVLVLWVLNDSFEQPAKILFLLALAAVAFLSVYLASKVVLGL